MMPAKCSCSEKHHHFSKSLSLPFSDAAHGEIIISLKYFQTTFLLHLLSSRPFWTVNWRFLSWKSLFYYSPPLYSCKSRI